MRRALHQHRVQAGQGAEEPQSGRDAGRRPSTGTTAGCANPNSQDPHLLLWHWTNNTSPEARASFLAQEGTPSLEEPELQLALGGIYAKSEPGEGHQADAPCASYRGGTRSTADPHRPSTLYMGQKRFDQAHLWGKVSESFQESPEVSATRLGIYHAIGKEEQETLDDQAATIVDALRQGSYRTP